MPYFDVIVLGGGPAGCATALSLRRETPSLSVAIVERSDYTALRIGETLPPNIDGLLTHLGIWEAFLEGSPLEAYGTRACWGSAAAVENEFIFQRQGRGWHLDRSTFDRMLASEAVRAGSQLFMTARISGAERTGTGWRMEIHQAGGSLPVDCHFVVDATGRTSSFAIQQGAKHIDCDGLAGCFLFFTASRPIDSYALVEAFEHGWTYSATVPDGHVAAAILSDIEILRQLKLRSAPEWLAVLGQTPETYQRLEGCEPAGMPFIRSAASRQLDIAAGDGWIAAGDAASTFDPLSSQGIYKAIRSGIFASYAIRDGLQEADCTKYQRFVRDEYNEYLDMRAAYYAQEQRWPEAPFWKRRHEQITLDPARMIQASLDAADGAGAHLTAGEISLILDLCRRPCPAHHVVREFAARSPRPVPQRRLVLAIQDLLDAGVVRHVS